MKNTRRITPLAVALTASLTTASAQTLVWSDDFDDNNPIGWTLTSLAHISEVNQQFMVYGYFGPLQTNNPTGTHAAGYHSIPTSGPLPDNQTLELRADLLGTSEDDAWADLHFLWLPQGQGYILFKDQDEIALCKFYNGANALAWFFYESRALKNENVTLVLALARRGSNLEITTRVLDEDNANALLFERTVTDTPQADPVLPDGSMRVPRSAPDPAGTPWPIAALPGYVELSVTWVNTQSAPAGAGAAVFDDLQVWQYESPQVAIQKARSSPGRSPRDRSSWEAPPGSLVRGRPCPRPGAGPTPPGTRCACWPRRPCSSSACVWGLKQRRGNPAPRASRRGIARRRRIAPRPLATSLPGRPGGTASTAARAARGGCL